MGARAGVMNILLVLSIHLVYKYKINLQKWMSCLHMHQQRVCFFGQRESPGAELPFYKMVPGSRKHMLGSHPPCGGAIVKLPGNLYIGAVFRRLQQISCLKIQRLAPALLQHSKRLLNTCRQSRSTFCRTYCPRGELKRPKCLSTLCSLWHLLCPPWRRSVQSGAIWRFVKD